MAYNNPFPLWYPNGLVEKQEVNLITDPEDRHTLANALSTMPVTNTIKRDSLKQYVLQNITRPCDVTEFSSVWNALAGRSTTKATDVPLIIANCLHLKCGDMLKYTQPEHMYQAILLSSRASVPLSLFSNTGPRYVAGGRNLNRWIPTSNGRMILRSKETFISHIRRKYPLLLLYSRARGKRDISIFILEGEEWSIPKSFFRFSNLDGAYVVQPRGLYAEEAMADGCTTTCLIMEEGDDPKQWPPVRRGSCFTVVRRYTGTSAGAHWPHLTLELIFRGPVLFHQALASECTDCTDENTLKVNPLENRVELRVLCGTSATLYSIVSWLNVIQSYFPA